MSDEQDVIDEMRRSMSVLVPAVHRVMQAANDARRDGRLRGNNNTLAAAENLRDYMRSDPRIGAAAGRLTGPQRMQVFADQERAVRTGQTGAGRGLDTGNLAALRAFTEQGQARPGSQPQSGVGDGARPRTPGQPSGRPDRDRGRG